jgi:Domain of unknown function (DUF1788)
VLSLQDRIDLLEADLKTDPPAFIMSRQLPFAIFRYDPQAAGESEWQVRAEIQKLATRVQNWTGQRVGVVSLAALFWRSIQESESIDAIVELEREHGFETAERQVNSYLSDDDFRPLQDLIIEAAEAQPAGTKLLFLAHATVFAPAAYRISSLLEQMSGKLKIPAVLFYPGTWNHTLNYMGTRTEDQSMGSYRVKIYGRES